MVQQPLAEVVERFGIGDRITTGVAVERATWLDDACTWEASDSQGGVHRARVLVGAVGMFNERVRPDSRPRPVRARPPAPSR